MKPQISQRLSTYLSLAGAPSWRSCLLALALAASLSACGGMLAFRESEALFAEGQVDAGLAKLDEAIRAEPNNPQFRIALASRRASLNNRLMAAGEAARREGRLSDAEKAFQQALRYDPHHAMAQQGLEAIVAERRHRLAVGEAETLFKQGGPGAIADALEKLRPVLSENPAQKDALNLKARIEEAQAKQQKPEMKLAESFRKPISLEFRDMPLKSVFDVIAKLSGLNFFFDKDIRPDLKTSVLAKNTTVEDAVRLLLVTNQLEQRILNENTVLIYPNTQQKQQDYQSLSVRAFHLTNSDVKAVSNTIKTIVKTKDMVVDERLGLIILRDTPEAIRLAERIVALQDLSDPEVMLELEVLEIKRSRILDLGIQWPTQLTLAPLQTASAPLTLAALRHLGEASTQATLGSVIINARKEDQDSNILANPRIRVRNKDKAKILIGDRVPVITTTSTSTGFVSESINYVDVGLKLEVEPHIYLDEEVAIKINLEVSSLVREVISKTGSLSYQIGTRGANTVLRLKNGETQVLAGLISDEERSSGTKLPGLGDLPLAGRLFGSHKDDGQRSEIVLAITPRVVRSIRRPDLLMAEFESGTANNVGSPPLRLSTVEAPKGGKDGAAPAAALDGAALAAARSTPVAQPALASPAPAPAPSSATGGEAPKLSWQGPAQVELGEQFSVVLRVGSQDPLRGLPLVVGFDPQALQVEGVEEGEFFRQDNAQTDFSRRLDLLQGKLFVAVGQGAGAGISGTGSLVTVNFRAIRAGSADIQLLSATPEPLPAVPVVVPVEHALKILP